MKTAIVMGLSAAAGAFGTWMLLRQLVPIRFVSTVTQTQGPPNVDDNGVTTFPPLLFRETDIGS